MEKWQNQRAWFLVMPVVLLVAFNALIPLMTVVNYSVQDIFDSTHRLFVGTEWYREMLLNTRLHECAAAPVVVLGAGAADRTAAGRGDRPDHAAQGRLGNLCDAGYPRVSAADSLERDRHDLGHLSAAGRRLARTFHRPHAGHPFRLSDRTDRRPGFR